MFHSCIAQYVCAWVGLPNQATCCCWDTNLSVIASRLRYLPLWTSNWDGILQHQPVVTGPYFCFRAKLSRHYLGTKKPLAIKIAARSPSPHVPAHVAQGGQKGPRCLCCFNSQLRFKAQTLPACWQGWWVTSRSVLPTFHEKEEGYWGLQCLKSLKASSCNGLNAKQDSLSCIRPECLSLYTIARTFTQGFLANRVWCVCSHGSAETW